MLRSLFSLRSGLFTPNMELVTNHCHYHYSAPLFFMTILYFSDSIPKMDTKSTAVEVIQPSNPVQFILNLMYTTTESLPLYLAQKPLFIGRCIIISSASFFRVAHSLVRKFLLFPVKFRSATKYAVMHCAPAVGLRRIFVDAA